VTSPAPDHVFFVLSEPPAEIDAAEYNRWYEVHVREVLALPGFVAAERSQLRFIRSSSGDAPPFTFAVRYEIEGDFDSAMRALRAAVDAGGMTFPDWYGGVSSAGWEAIAVGGRVESAVASGRGAQPQQREEST
jgi:hypothetical protein